LIVPDAGKREQSVGMPLRGSSDKVVGYKTWPRLNEGKRDAILVHVGNKRIRVVDRPLRQAAIVKVRVPRPERNEVFRGSYVFAQVRK
jgi:hypothetical protein